MKVRSTEEQLSFSSTFSTQKYILFRVKVQVCLNVRKEAILEFACRVGTQVDKTKPSLER